jgi:Leu/Phe-tRNA-protein transferase
VLLDTQFVTPHLKTFGALEIPRANYLARLDAALKRTADFAHLPTDHPIAGADALAIIAAATPDRPR